MSLHFTSVIIDRFAKDGLSNGSTLLGYESHRELFVEPDVERFYVWIEKLNSQLLPSDSYQVTLFTVNHIVTHITQRSIPMFGFDSRQWFGSHIKP